jgi:hypothetical protein
MAAAVPSRDILCPFDPVVAKAVPAGGVFSGTFRVCR